MFDNNKIYIDPFEYTKSTLMSSGQIENLWVKKLNSIDTSLITSKQNLFLLGSKGSGKTHILRKHSFQVQKFRFEVNKLSIEKGLKKDGYISTYYQCTSGMSSIFKNKGTSDEVWDRLFQYSFEISFALKLLDVVSELDFIKLEQENVIVESIKALFFKPEYLDHINNFSGLIKFLKDCNNKIYFEVNQITNDHSGISNIEILFNRTSLLLNIPDICQSTLPALKNITFIYIIDEIEHLSECQQKFINTLVYDFQDIGVKIGCRTYGVKTIETLGVEKIRKSSEVEIFKLDDSYRESYVSDKTEYKEFFIKVVDKRLKNVDEESIDPENLFGKFSYDWKSEDILAMVNSSSAPERRYFNKFRSKMNFLSNKFIDQIIKNLSFGKFPVLEQTGIFAFYKLAEDIKKPNDSLEEYLKISESLKSEIENLILKDNLTSAKKDSPNICEAWDKYKMHIIFKMFHSYAKQPVYSGFDNLVRTSEGIPRNFINTLKYIDNRSYKLKKNPRFIDEVKSYSHSTQSDAFKYIASSFFDDINECDDKEKLTIAINRLAHLFQLNHYSDRPKECSLISFSCEDFHKVNQEAESTIEMCKLYSLIIEEKDGRPDKNGLKRHIKFRLNRTLCPKWNLPLTKGGTVQFSPANIEAIFDHEKEDDFESLYLKWESETEFKVKAKKVKVKNLKIKVENQEDLF